MNQLEEFFPNAWFLRLNRLEDSRGFFVKTVSKSILKKLSYNFELQEEYYTSSKKNVIRGMHFQTPPHDHVKLVYCALGSVLDVMLDLRVGPNYGKIYSVVLDAASPSLLIIPKGVAHGFKALEENSLMVYKTSTEHEAQHDTGILWDSFGFEWGVNSVILSERDQNHVKFDKFISPFK